MYIEMSDHKLEEQERKIILHDIRPNRLLMSQIK